MQSRSHKRLLVFVQAEQQLLFFALFAERFRRLLGALARAFRGAYVVCVVIRFLHRDLQNKTSCLASQGFFARLGYTKVTGSEIRISLPVLSLQLRRGRSAAEQMDDEGNHRQRNQDVNQAAGNVQRQPQNHPDHRENDRNRQEHTHLLGAAQCELQLRRIPAFW